jgi:hypothetical protein
MGEKTRIVRWTARSGMVREIHIVESRKLAKININSAGLVSIDLSELTGFRRLRELKLWSNHMTEIDLSPIASCDHLREINLSHNKLQSLDLSPLTDCRNLSWLSIAGNEIPKLDLSPLAKMEKLEVLKLSNNWLSEIDLTPLESCLKLKQLFLDRNRIKRLDISALFRFPALREFRFDPEVIFFAHVKSKQKLRDAGLFQIINDNAVYGKRIEWIGETTTMEDIPSTVHPHIAAALLSKRGRSGRHDLHSEMAYVRETPAKRKDIKRNHNILANRFKTWLESKGAEDIVMEQNYVDLTFKQNEYSCIAELKVVGSTSTTSSIREAIGQLFEYNFYDDADCADRWFIVLDDTPSIADVEYIEKLREKLDIPIYLMYVDADDFRVSKSDQV